MTTRKVTVTTQVPKVADVTVSKTSPTKVTGTTLVQIAPDVTVSNPEQTVASRQKLSKLQKWILEKAGEQTRLYYAEIKIRYYGLKGDFRSPGSHNLDPAENPNYRAASAAISRAVKRLEQRGLIVVLTGVNSHWTAVQLKSPEMQERERVEAAESAAKLAQIVGSCR